MERNKIHVGSGEGMQPASPKVPEISLPPSLFHLHV